MARVARQRLGVTEVAVKRLQPGKWQLTTPEGVSGVALWRYDRLWVVLDGGGVY